MIQNNLTSTMQYFGKLTASERELFLSVITTEKVVKTHTKKKKSTIPFELTEEYYYEKLKQKYNAKNHRISKRLTNLK